MWYEYLYRVLSIVNYTILVLIGVVLFPQILYILLFFLKKKSYPKSEKKARIAYLFPAHNEGDVIYESVKSVFDKQDYPKELFDVFVVVHNCTDNTEEQARKAGAKIIILNDPDPNHRMALYPLKKGINDIMSGVYGNYDMIIRVDADNHLSANYSTEMNNAFQSGVDLARPYEGAYNGNQNFFTRACGILYVMESRYGSRVRERLNLGAHVNGSGAMMSVRMLKATGGYDCVTISEDAEYYFNRLLDGYKSRYVEDAVVYEDMPSSFRDTIVRNQRIGNGNSTLFKTKLPKLLLKFFKTGDLSCLEVFLTYFLLVLTVPLCIWIPLYYVYHFTFLSFVVNGTLAINVFPMAFYEAQLWNNLWGIIGVISGLFFLFGYVQSSILAFTEYKRLGAKKRSDLFFTVISFPFFILLYSVTICIGTLIKPKKWGQAKRNVGHDSHADGN